MLIEVENLSFSYGLEAVGSPTLKGVSFSIERGEFVAIRGRSGSGKSTLFYIIGCLLRPTSGAIRIAGKDLSTLGRDELAYLRNREIGFVFQQFHLLPRASVLDNILLPSLYPCELEGRRTPEDKARAVALAEQVGLGDKLHKLPNQLSGGEQQRVAIARALLSDPDVILADEPTGNLDSVNAERIMSQLKALNAAGKTVILITHDLEIARQCPRTLHLSDGELLSDSKTSEGIPPEAPVPSAKLGPTAPLRLTFGALLRMLKTVAPLAVENLRRNRVRAFLTMVGVTVGIASVFSMITFGSFARQKILQGYEDLGVRSVIIRGHKNYHRRATDYAPIPFRSFSWEKDILPLKRIFPQIDLLSPVLGSWGNTVSFGGESIQEVLTLGGTPAFFKIFNRGVSEGRMLTPYHIEQRSSVCLVGPEIVSRLFKDISPIGRILFVTKDEDLAYPCQIIGVLNPQSSNKSWHKPNLDVVVPYTFFQSVNHYWENEIVEFAAQLTSGADMEAVGKAIKAYFDTKYGVAGKFDVDSDTILVAQMKRFLGLFALMLTSIAVITLGVGGMGINNMMLVSIAERLKEIGLRKAMGATDRSIRIQFLLEATLLSIIAGVAGVLLGFSAYELIIYGASRLVNQIQFEWILNPFALALSLLSILVVGIGSGIVPALKAERLNVIEALRTE